MGHLEEASAGVLAGVDSLEAFFDDRAGRDTDLWTACVRRLRRNWSRWTRRYAICRACGGSASSLCWSSGSLLHVSTLGLPVAIYSRSRTPKKVALIHKGLQQFIRIFCCQTVSSRRAYNVNFLRNILPLNVLPPTPFSH